MPFVTSADGTRIGYTIEGAGPAIIFIEGAMCYRTSGAWDAVAERLKDRFSCLTYDRRGRGESGDAADYTRDKEIEDIAALIAAAGGKVTLAGLSSGGAIALSAADRLGGVERVIVYEAPFVVDDTLPPMPADFRASIEKAVRENRRGDALRIFMRRVGMPGFMLAIMSFMPVWKRLKAIAHTLSYDLRFVETYSDGRSLPPDAWPGIAVPVLVIGGGKSPAWLQNAQKAIAATVAGATHKTLEGQTHMVKPDPLSQAIVRFMP
jgi:pimeloyl-ACP methyl ester carboxylesterase